MRQKRITFIFLAVGMLLVAVSAILLTTNASAQCGSQASSCKNCHETQAQKPVNNDGTAWHTQHAFGDFCYLCHGGNNQATDETAAHTGMVDPLTDIATSCKSCHPTDFTDKAQIYATTLGVTLGSGGTSSSATAAPTSASVTTPVVQSTPAPAAATAVVPASDMVDYSQRYNETVLGQKPSNVGNIILIALLVVIVLVGGFFVLRREGWINISFDDPKRVAVKEKFPADVVEMLPGIGKLKPDSRRILKNILDKPDAAGELFASIDKLTHTEPAEKPAPAETSGEESSEDKDS
jgi:hypothetical protein